MPLFRPGKPHVSFGHLAAQVMVAATESVSWQSIKFEEGTSSTVPTTAYTVDRSGLYSIVWGCGRGTRALPEPTDFRLRLVAGNIALNEVRVPATTLAVRASGATLEQLDEGDSIDLQVTAAVGATIPGAQSVRLSIVRIGPVRWT